MKSQAEFWKNWWNEQARHAGSDYSLNRQTSVHLEDFERRAVRGFLAAVDPQSQDVILDAGCGSGRNISILAPLVKEVVGTDYSEQIRGRRPADAPGLPSRQGADPGGRAATRGRR